MLHILDPWFVSYSISLLLSVTSAVCLVTVILSCAFCLRYFLSVLGTSEPVAQAKRAAIQRNIPATPGAKQPEELKVPPPSITIDLETGSRSPRTLHPVTLTYDDEILGTVTFGEEAKGHNLYTVSDVGSVYSDVSDATTDSLTSPLSTPGVHHKTFLNVDSEGGLSPIPKNRHGAKRSTSHEGHGRGGRKRLLLRRSLSVPDFRAYVHPELTFNICYNAKRHSLEITDVQVKDVGITSGHVAVKILLCPEDITARTESRPVPSATDMLTFEGFVQFDDLNHSDLQRLSLLITLYQASVGSGKKLSTIGEVLIKVSELGVKDEAEVKVTRALQPKRRSKKKSTSSNSLLRELGDLFILIQYQSHANRLKVLVRKASRLPSAGKLPGQPDHMVAVLLRHGSHVLDSRETRAQKGCDPIWNEPFLFDVSGLGDDALNAELSLEFVLHRGRIYTKDNVLGHVMVGSGAPPGGLSHWHDVMMPTGMEVARWHPVLPVFRYV